MSELRELMHARRVERLGLLVQEILGVDKSAVTDDPCEIEGVRLTYRPGVLRSDRPELEVLCDCPQCGKKDAGWVSLMHPIDGIENLSHAIRQIERGDQGKCEECIAEYQRRVAAMRGGEPRWIA